MDFIFIHPGSREQKTISLSEEEIQDRLADELHDELSCDCQPIGETNVVECGCDDYIQDFELIDRKA